MKRLIDNEVLFSDTILVLTFCVLLMTSPCVVSVDRVSCFILGKVRPSLCPLTSFFSEDPLFVYSLEPIPSGLSDEERRKFDRQYFPRSRSALIESIDMMFFSDARVQHFSPRQFGDIEYAFTEAGMPSFWSFGPAWLQAVEPTILRDMVPVREYEFYYHKNWRVSFREEAGPVFGVFRELGMERVQGDAYAIMVPKQGSKIWADMVPLDLPWLVSWNPGGKNPGIAWVCADEFNRQWWSLTASSRGENPYAIDFTTNLILHSLDRPLIRDIHERRKARNMISTFKSRKLLILSMMEWADNFGANVLPLYSRFTELEEEVEVALDYYLEQDYQPAISALEGLDAQVAQIGREAVAMKDQALFWVFLSEWLAVSSVSIITGVTVWTLMVKRKAYRAVSTTRMAKSD